MLKKCLKHDLKYVLNYWIMATAVFGVICVIGAISLRLMALSDGDPGVMTVLGIIVFYLGSAAYALFGAGMSIYRCHQSCFTDEGYLTFTLPVKRQTLLVSKVLSIVITFLASLAVMAILYHGVFAVVPSDAFGMEGNSLLGGFYVAFGSMLGAMFADNGVFAVLYIIEAIVIAALVVIGLATGIFHSLAKYLESKKKPKRMFITVVLIYLLFTPAMMLIGLSSFGIMAYIEALTIAGTLTAAEVSLSIALWMMMAIAFLVILCSIEYHFALRRISEKLNLE